MKKINKILFLLSFLTSHFVVAGDDAPRAPQRRGASRPAASQSNVCMKQGQLLCQALENLNREGVEEADLVYSFSPTYQGKPIDFAKIIRKRFNIRDDIQEGSQITSAEGGLIGLASEEFLRLKHNARRSLIEKFGISSDWSLRLIQTDDKIRDAVTLEAFAILYRQDDYSHFLQEYIRAPEDTVVQERADIRAVPPTAMQQAIMEDGDDEIDGKSDVSVDPTDVGSSIVRLQLPMSPQEWFHGKINRNLLRVFGELVSTPQAPGLLVQKHLGVAKYNQITEVLTAQYAWLNKARKIPLILVGTENYIDTHGADLSGSPFASEGNVNGFKYDGKKEDSFEQRMLASKTTIKRGKTLRSRGEDVREDISASGVKTIYKQGGRAADEFMQFAEGVVRQFRYLNTAAVEEAHALKFLENLNSVLLTIKKSIDLGKELGGAESEFEIYTAAQPNQKETVRDELPYQKFQLVLRAPSVLKKTPLERSFIDGIEEDTNIEEKLRTLNDYLDQKLDVRYGEPDSAKLSADKRARSVWVVTFSTQGLSAVLEKVKAAGRQGGASS